MFYEWGCAPTDYLFDSLWGNTVLRSVLSEKLRLGHIAHAYLLAGSCGSGKHTLARLLSAALNCTDPARRPCGHCIHCRKNAENASPDFYSLGDDLDEKHKSIGVDAVRTIKDTLYIAPNEMAYKVYMIAHADKLTVQAQNALLKMLEEPPADAVFLLLCENRFALLPTVLSRVQLLQTERFSDEALDALLLDRVPLARQASEETRALAVRLSGGTVGRALFYLGADEKTLAGDSAYRAHEGVLAMLRSVASGGVRHSRAAVAGVLTAYGDTRERMALLLDTLCFALRDLIYASKEGDGARFLFFTDTKEEAEFDGIWDVGSLLAVFDVLSELRQTVEVNPNVGLLQNTVASRIFDMMT